MSDRKQKILQAVDVGSDNDQYNCDQLAYAADWIIKLQDALRELNYDGLTSRLIEAFTSDPDYGMTEE